MTNGALRTALDRLRRTVGPAGDRTDDAALLARFAAERDPAAFELLVVRHGPMVRALCRRVLRHEQDAEDAFQATFLALAKSAGAVGRGSLAGWLYRVASHVAFKAKARSARRREAPALDDFAADGDPAIACERSEVRAVLDEEVARLPARFRLPVVLCYFGGKSNTEAAAELGCPRGTVDSRLATARQRLRVRLSRRGLAPAVAAAVIDRLAATGAVGAPLSSSVVRSAVRAALAFTSSTAAADGVISPAAAALAHGVLHMAFLNKLVWTVGVLIGIGVLGTGGVTTYQALADDPSQASGQPTQPIVAKGEPTKLETAAQVAGPASARDLRALLRKPAGLERPIDEMPLKDALEFLSDKFNVTIRIDPAAFTKYQVVEPFTLYDAPVRLPVVRGMTLGDILRDLLAQLKPENTSIGGFVTYLVKGSHIVIVPAFLTPYVGTVGAERVSEDSQPLLNPDLVEEQFLGDRLSVEYQETPLTDILRDLADSTGANIVLDNRQKEKGQTPITISLQQVRLFKALQVIADMAGLEPVPLHNVYYVTTPENAKRLAKREFPQPAVPVIQSPPYAPAPAKPPMQ
jgi:RNA polymerase sigma factor (sigma-70 family)